MSLLQRVQSAFATNIAVQESTFHLLSESIVQAAILMTECLQSDNKILACGNGGSATDAQHFVAELVNRFIVERPPLAAIALTTDAATITAIANDYAYARVFAKQIEALGKEDDVLLAISTSGNSQNVIEAIVTAKECGLKIIALTGKDGGQIGAMLDEDDIELRVPCDITPRIQEVHILIIHCLCDIIDQILFGEDDENSEDTNANESEEDNDR